MRLQLSSEISVCPKSYRADQSYSSLSLYIVSRTRFLRIPADVISTITPLLTTVPLQCLLHTTRCCGVINKSQTLRCSHPVAPRYSSVPSAMHTHSHTDTQCIYNNCRSVRSAQRFLALKFLLAQVKDSLQHVCSDINSAHAIFLHFCHWSFYHFCILFISSSYISSFPSFPVQIRYNLSKLNYIWIWTGTFFRLLI